MYKKKIPPHCGEQLYLTDGGLETSLIFHEGVQLPHFAAFDLLSHARGQRILTEYYRRYLDIAVSAGLGFVAESPTWRASRDWGEKLGYQEARLRALNIEAIAIMDGLRADYMRHGIDVAVSGSIGPRGDGYVAGSIMSPAEAQRYHSAQIDALSIGNADFITAMTITNTEEAIGITRACEAADLACVISFTAETNGMLPTGQSLQEAIDETDRSTRGGPACYMINCAHPSHFSDQLPADESWTKRVRGIRANASTCSHAELDEAEHLDDGDPQALAMDYAKLRARHPQLMVLGGCCGTDHRHIQKIVEALKLIPGDCEHSTLQ